MRRRLLLIAFTTLLCLPALGQRSGSLSAPTEQRISIVVQVRSTDDRSFSERLRVELLSASGIEVAEAFTDSEGHVEIPGQSPGDFKLRVSGFSVETTTTTEFTVQERETRHMEYVHVKGKASEEGEKASAPGTPPTVSAHQMNVPDKAADEFEKGLEAFGKGDTDKAIARFKKATELYPQYAQAYANIGVAYMSKGDLVSARKAFEQSVVADDKFVPGYISLGKLDNREKNYADSEKVLLKAMAVDPNNVEALSLLANAQFHLNEFDKALVTARRVHQFPHPQYADCHLVAAESLMHMNNGKEAIPELETFLKEDPSSPKAPQVRQAMAQLQAQAN